MSKEALNKSSMSRVAVQIAMIARSATKVAAATRYREAADCGSSRRRPFPHQPAAPHRVRVVSGPTWPPSAARRARDLAATRTGTGFAGGLRRWTRCEGGLPFAASSALHPIPHCAKTARRASVWRRPLYGENRVRGHVGLVQCFLKLLQSQWPLRFWKSSI